MRWQCWQAAKGMYLGQQLTAFGKFSGGATGLRADILQALRRSSLALTKVVTLQQRTAAGIE